MTAPAVSDLAARILAAIDKTVRVARATADIGPGFRPFPLEWETSPTRSSVGGRDHLVQHAGGGLIADCMGKADAEHIALNDPAKTLLRCAADRETVAELLKIVNGDYIDAGELPLAEWMLGRLAAAYDIATEAP